MTVMITMFCTSYSLYRIISK